MPREEYDARMTRTPDHYNAVESNLLRSVIDTIRSARSCPALKRIVANGVRLRPDFEAARDQAPGVCVVLKSRLTTSSFEQAFLEAWLDIHITGRANSFQDSPDGNSSAVCSAVFLRFGSR